MLRIYARAFTRAVHKAITFGTPFGRGWIRYFTIAQLIGEPARKAMIVDFANESLRGALFGLYYLLHSLSITPAAAIECLLWNITPRMPFIIAGLIGMVGTVVFAATVE